MAQPFKITGTSKFSRTKKKPQMPLLPGDMEILRQMEKQREDARSSTSINEPLEYISPLKNFRPAETINCKELDICLIVRSLLCHMWKDFPKNDKGGFTISGKTVAETAEFRESIPKAVTLSQLYGIFPSRTTQIDRAVSQATRNGQIRVIPLNAHDGSLDLIMDCSEFYAICDNLNIELAAQCRARPDTIWFDVKELQAAKVDVGKAVSQGLLVVDPGKPGVHCLSIPNQGRLLKLVRQCRTWLLRTMVQGNRKFKELPESQILDRLLSTKRYWSQMKGVTLEWILYDAIGSGYVDGFNTPIGRGWKVLRG